MTQGTMIRLATKSMHWHAFAFASTSTQRVSVSVSKSIAISSCRALNFSTRIPKAFPSSSSSAIHINIPITSPSPAHPVHVDLKDQGKNKDKEEQQEDPGRKYYQLAKEHLVNHERNQLQEEEMKQKEQYRSRDNDKSEDAGKDKGKGKGSGIQVIKTIVKQNRSERARASANKFQGHTQTKDKTKTDLEKAQECMQLSAFVHGYNDAIVSLANHALSKSSDFDAEEEFKYVMNLGTSTRTITDIEKEVKMADEDGTTNMDILDLDSIRHCKSGAEVAMILYKHAGENGSKEGWFNLGHLLWTGHKHNHDESGDGDAMGIGIDPDIPMALECFEKAVELNDDDARYFLAVHYIGGGEGEGTVVGASEIENELDSEEEMMEERRMRGLKLVQEAGDNGHAGALYYLALLHRNGDATLDVEPNMRLFREYLDEAADPDTNIDSDTEEGRGGKGGGRGGGDADALFLKAHCQFHGEDGYNVDYRAALDGFIMAGDSGNADGYVSAGAMLHRGISTTGATTTTIPQDQRRAFELYQQAGEMGSLDGWRNVVACYMSGEGVPRCEQTAKYIAKTMLNKEAA